ncbi:flagellar hook protein FlgE [Paraburkholderia guartelaensis]|uniref:flagellar hook protein FlgE n=1 Tax=Paraburkholderia guartelaensis TaxID=2546446 RepID=UPI002AB64F8B|nr:flagellar hook protein FlgE [Paraburkholderia guartelaensis]
MGYQQGLSGLAAASQDLQVIGNNLANANTVGFKQSVARFSDMYANSINSVVNNQIGIGTRLATVQQQFTQGGIMTTGRELDIAINGNGFFQMQSNGVLTYSRDGSFEMRDGYIVNSAGQYLMGYAANGVGVINTASTVPLKIPMGNLPPKATTSINASFNLNAQDSLPKNTPFASDDAASYNFMTPTTVYDSLGGAQDVNMYFVKTATGSWDVYAGARDGVISRVGNAQFDTSGKIVATTDNTGAPTAKPFAFDFTVPTTDGSATPQSLTLHIDDTTQYGGKSGINRLEPDGYQSAQLAGFSVDADGMLVGTYTNGKTQAIGQVPLVTFANPNGLVNLGGNQYASTLSSGTPQIAAPGSTNHGVLQGAALETSNVDLTNELVHLISAQRNYQANAQTIKTQQAVDNTLLNL